ncbi:DUF1800 domain-containing protein [Aquimarina pacifica]|uniref:DUF1800 domain-containing protein n=1 Tax=Aquimarina pacifica TaxID=1296415 RepID=UPI0004B39DBA|nr:DUF1800 domain-containing protein [Aquimarina pacifica]
MMSSDTSCNLATLAEYVPSATNPWNVTKIHHLYRRIAFGASKPEVLSALSQTPGALVDTLIDDAIALNTTAEPIWAFWNRDQFEAAEMLNEDNSIGYYLGEGKAQMINDLIQNKVRDRLTLFWSNHFVTEDEEYRSPAYQYQYYNLLQLHALGNFRDFVYDVGICNAMLVYLNGDENINDRPNENYARELYELFTLGVDNNYTEDDIQETAKALTGYVDTNDISWGDILFNASRFSNENKDIFGEVGNWGYDDVIRILFEQRETQVATFICGKLYTYFVSPTCSDVIVAEMAQTFISTGYNIAEVLRQLFKSEHFFDQEAIGSIVKSPCDLMICYYNETGFELPANLDVVDSIFGSTEMLGQEMLNPIDVEGWQGNHDWISPDLLLGRWESIRYLMSQAYNQNQTQFGDFVIGMPIGELADGNLAITETDVEHVVATILNYFFPRGIDDAIIFNEAVGVFKIDGIPENYFEDGTWTVGYPELPDQFAALLNYIAEIPEFQLK